MTGERIALAVAIAGGLSSLLWGVIQASRSKKPRLLDLLGRTGIVLVASTVIGIISGFLFGQPATPVVTEWVVTQEMVIQDLALKTRRNDGLMGSNSRDLYQFRVEELSPDGEEIALTDWELSVHWDKPKVVEEDREDMQLWVYEFHCTDPAPLEGDQCDNQIRIYVFRLPNGTLEKLEEAA